MDEKLYNVLSLLGVPVRKFRYNGNAETYITYFGMLEQGEMFADNRERYTGHYYQVDLWSKDDVAINILYEQARRALLEAGFIRRDKQEFYEDDERMYHYALTIAVAEVTRL